MQQVNAAIYWSVNVPKEVFLQDFCRKKNNLLEHQCPQRGFSTGLLQVEAPWVKMALYCDDIYIIPGQVTEDHTFEKRVMRRSWFFWQKKIGRKFGLRMA